MTPKRLNGSHQAVNIAVRQPVADRERRPPCAPAFGSPSSQSSVSSRAGRQLRPRPRHADQVGAGQHRPVERDVLGLALVIELLAHPRADLLGDLGGVDRRIHPAVDREQTG